MEVFATYALLAIPVVVHLAVDLHKRYTGHVIRHWISALIAVMCCALCGGLDALINDKHWWQFAIYALGVHFAFFDLVWNWASGHPWHYNGDPMNPERAWTDKMWDYVPVYAQPLVRGWALGVGIGVYYHLDLIVG